MGSVAVEWLGGKPALHLEGEILACDSVLREVG